MSSVCHITTGHHPYDKRIFHKEVKALDSLGYDVTVLAHAKGTTIRDGIKIVGLGERNTKSDRITHLRKAYQSAIEINADVYHLHDPELLLIGGLLSRNTDGKVIFDAHEDFGQNAVYRRPWIPDIGREVVRECYPLVQQTLVRPLDAVITTTEQIASEFRSQNYPNVTIVRNFPITENIEIIEPSVQPSHQYTLVYVGALSEARGLMQMLQTHHQLRRHGVDVGLWLIGPFQGEAKKNERCVSTYLQKHDLEDHVELFGYIPHEEIFGYLNMADVGLSLVDKRQFEYILPTKIFEYMYTGLPVVMTDTGPARNYVNESYGALVENNTEQIAEFICEWIQADRLDEMGEAGRQKVLNEYNWENEKESLGQLYADLL